MNVGVFFQTRSLFYLLVLLEKSCCLLRAKQLRNLPHFARSQTFQVCSLTIMWFLLVFYLSNRLATRQQSFSRKTFSQTHFVNHIVNKCFVTHLIKNNSQGDNKLCLSTQRLVAVLTLSKEKNKCSSFGSKTKFLSKQNPMSPTPNSQVFRKAHSHNVAYRKPN